MKQLGELGFSFEESQQLRRIEMTLQRWGELECGDANGHCIERDEETGKPFLTFDKSRPNGERGRVPVADREAGALRRLAKIMTGHPELVAYHQGDCRGCNLYVLKRTDIAPGETVHQVYTRGLAVCD